MSWNPSERYIGGELYGQALRGIGQDFFEAITKYEDEKKKDRYNTAIFEALKSNPETAKYIPKEALERWHKLDSDKQAGYNAAIQMQVQDERVRQQIQTQQQLANLEKQKAAREKLITDRILNRPIGSTVLDAEGKPTGAIMGATDIHFPNPLGSLYNNMFPPGSIPPGGTATDPLAQQTTPKTIAEFRRSYPMYANIPDDQLKQMVKQKLGIDLQ